MTSTSSPPGFTPRKEFIREQQTTPNSFALLALSSSNFIRLYSFAPSFLTGLRRLFELQGIAIASREDQPQNLYEFSVDGKPWANPKAVTTEKLLIDIITLIYQAGYTFLSSVDYGREHDDRLAMAFSRPVPLAPSGSRTTTPLPPGGSPYPDVSSTSLHDKSRARRVPFALSFASATVMRVIAPPLHLTPAILQAVRASWPRGVVSEKKVGENCFEFKLKGYKWFQQDTFASDSLQHILSLLTSLDAHSFSLLTSISLTNRSRVKDLWVFTGPSPQPPEDISSHNSSPEHVSPDPLAVNSRMVQHTDSFAQQQAASRPMQTQHRRLATEPIALPSHLEMSRHPEDMSHKPFQPLNTVPVPPTQPPHLLRKPAPRAQVPVSVVHEHDISEPEVERRRINLPSTISSGIENMTGIGARGQTQDTSYTPFPFENIPPYGSPSPPPTPSHMPPRFAVATSHDLPVIHPVSDRVKTPPLLSNTPPASPYRHPNSPSSQQVDSDGSINTEEKQSPQMTQSLLSPGTFRDSAFSTQSNMSCEIPIKWTGLGKEDLKQDQNALSRGRLHSNSPNFPGGWQPTPIDEKQEEDVNIDDDGKPFGDVQTPIHENISRVESPEVVGPDLALRKSEAALIGVITATLPPPPMPQLPLSDRSPKKDNNSSVQAGGGQGWVLVNVEGSSVAPPVAETNTGLVYPTRSRDTPSSSSQHGAASGSVSGVSRLPNAYEQPSPAAKAIVIIDALDSKQKKPRSASNRELAEGSSVRRFFSLNKKNSRKVLDSQAQLEPEDDSRVKNTTIPRSNLRDKLRLIGTPEASRREDKRRSID